MPRVKASEDKILDMDDIIRVADASRMTGYSRASIHKWTEGKGRGHRVKLPSYRMFDDSLPVLSLTEFRGWLVETKDDGSETFAKQAKGRLRQVQEMPQEEMVKTTISYPADDAPEPAGTEVTTVAEALASMAQVISNLNAEVAELKQAKK